MTARERTVVLVASPAAAATRLHAPDRLRAPGQQQWAQYQSPLPPKNRTPRRGKHAGREILAGAGGLIAAIIVIIVATSHLDG